MSAEELRELRALSGLSLRELGRLATIDSATLCRFERGQLELGAERLELLERLLVQRIAEKFARAGELLARRATGRCVRQRAEESFAGRA